jgi:glycopeptide antibiotics resistance protein
VPDSGHSARGSRWSGLAAAAYLAFVAYGSFVPLHFTPRPFDEAWYLFETAIPFRLSRTDLAANFLLMAPFPFLLLSALPSSRTAAGRFAMALGVWLLSSLLSVLIEFGQIYFPPRDPSLYDIAAQSAGAAAGVLAWLFAGHAVASAWRRWRTAYGAPALAEWILWPYLAVIFFYNVMPLDLTASPAAVYHKLRAGGIVLVPFSRAPGDPAHFLYSLVVDVAVWVPIAALLVLSGRASGPRGFFLTVAFAAAIEGIQLLVISRVSDVTDLITAALGSAAGVWLGSTWNRRLGGVARERAPAKGRSWALAGLAGAGLWLFVLAALFWYPFDFHWDRGFAKERLASFRRPLLQTYWTGSEMRALTEVIHKTVFFAPLGAALAIAVFPIRDRRARVGASVASILLIAVVALGIELGQVLLPRKVPDSTDAVLEAIGGTLGFLAMLSLRERLLLRPRGVPVRDQAHVGTGSGEA